MQEKSLIQSRLNSIWISSPRGTFIEGFGDDLAYIRYNGCIEGRFSSGELTDEENLEVLAKLVGKKVDDESNNAPKVY